MTGTEILTVSASLALFIIAAVVMIVGTCMRSDAQEEGSKPTDLR